MSDERPAAIVGGGLAGMAAALLLREHGVPVELFEARRALGGRAASFRDPATGELVDFCQHVSMGCCAHLADFCRRAEIESLFRRYRVLHFIGPDNRRYDLAASKALPAPLHLLPALLRLRYFSWGERTRLLRALWRLSRARSGTAEAEMTMRDWLRRADQSPAVVERFWALVLASALGETLDRVTVAAARKVFVDGFMMTRDGYQILVPQAPLGELYGRRVAARLR
jgi:predicted NAD/FAD-binding protein